MDFAGNEAIQYILLDYFSYRPSFSGKIQKIDSIKRTKDKIFIAYFTVSGSIRGDAMFLDRDRKFDYTIRGKIEENKADSPQFFKNSVKILDGKSGNMLYLNGDAADYLVFESVKYNRFMRPYRKNDNDNLSFFIDGLYVNLEQPMIKNKNKIYSSEEILDSTQIKKAIAKINPPEPLEKVVFYYMCKPYAEYNNITGEISFYPLDEEFYRLCKYIIDL
jgi:hypothetical protein